MPAVSMPPVQTGSKSKTLPTEHDFREMGEGVRLFEGVSWEDYVRVDQIRDRSGRKARLCFVNDQLEIRMTSKKHEIAKTLLANLIDRYLEVLDIDYQAWGEATFRKTGKAGGEPDVCYCLTEDQEYPDLAFEVVITSGGIKKLDFYERDPLLQ